MEEKEEEKLDAVTKNLKLHGGKKAEYVYLLFRKS